jgi:hypothetical protein
VIFACFDLRSSDTAESEVGNTEASTSYPMSPTSSEVASLETR